MKPFSILFAAALLSTGLALAADPAEARRGRDHAEDGAHRASGHDGHRGRGRDHAEDRGRHHSAGRHHAGRHRHCSWTWRDRRRARVCRWVRGHR